MDVYLKGNNMSLKTNSTPLGPTGRFFFKRIFPLPFLIIGACVLFFGFRSMGRAKASLEWPSVNGVVASSEIDKKRGDNGTTYSAEILYDYEVGGVTYSSNRVGYGDFGSSDPSWARKVVNRYPQGKEVTVYYMPDKPEESTLEKGVHKKTYLLPAFGSVFFLAGLAMFVYLPKLIAKQAE